MEQERNQTNGADEELQSAGKQALMRYAATVIPTSLRNTNERCGVQLWIVKK